MLRFRNTSPSDDRGQALVEFAVILPVAILILVGTIQLGITLGANNGVINSVREAARFGSVCVGGPTQCAGPTAQYAVDKIQGASFGTTGGASSRVEYQAYQDSSLPPKWNIRIRVTGCINGVTFTPLMGNLLNPANPSVIPLKSTETFRVEGQPSTNMPAGLTPAPGWGTAVTQGTC